MFADIQLNSQMTLKILKIVVFSVVVSMTLTSGTYYALNGADEQFYFAVLFSAIIPIICSFPVGYYLTFQAERLHLLNAELSRSREQTLRLNQKLQHEASHDGMTGTLNRSYFFALLEERLRDAGKEAGEDALLLVDADHFKKINDDFGHHKGDEALLAIAETLKGNAKPDDLVGRVGGEEFALLLKDTPLEKAVARAEKIRWDIAQIDFEAAANVKRRLTVSIGLNMAGDSDTEHPLRKADLALYTAKQKGRNRVEAYDPAMEKSAGAQGNSGIAMAVGQN